MVATEAILLIVVAVVVVVVVLACCWYQSKDKSYQKMTRVPGDSRCADPSSVMYEIDRDKFVSALHEKL